MNTNNISWLVIQLSKELDCSYVEVLGALRDESLISQEETGILDVICWRLKKEDEIS